MKLKVLANTFLLTLTLCTMALGQTKSDPKTLQEALDARKAEFAKKAPADLKVVYAEGIKAVKDSGILDRAMNVGDKAPNFKLKDAKGKSVSLKEYLAKGPVVLTWYRGGWCPYCNLSLHFLEKELPNFKAEGANLLALTPEKPDKSTTTAERNKLDFEILNDLGNKIGHKYGIIFKLTPEVAVNYQKAFDLHGYNGDNSDELPLAATYVIDTHGVIQYAFLSADYRDRAEPSDITKALKKLKK